MKVAHGLASRGHEHDERLERDQDVHIGEELKTVSQVR